MNRVARIHRFGEAKIVHAVVREHWTERRIDEQAGRGGNDEVSMCHSTSEDAIRTRIFVIHVRVEFVATQIRKRDDIVERDETSAGNVRIANQQLVERFAERMDTVVGRRRTLAPLARDRCNHRRAPLNRRPLHVVQHTARAAHLFAATRATRTTVHKIGQRRTVAGTLFCTRPVEHHQSTVIRRHSDNDLARDRCVAGDE